MESIYGGGWRLQAKEIEADTKCHEAFKAKRKAERALFSFSQLALNIGQAADLMHVWDKIQEDNLEADCRFILEEKRVVQALLKLEHSESRNGYVVTVEGITP